MGEMGNAACCLPRSSTGYSPTHRRIGTAGPQDAATRLLAEPLTTITGGTA